MDLAARCDAIEECYEFMLGYAAQGVSGGEITACAGQLRRLLTDAVRALDGLGDAFDAAVNGAGLVPAARYRSFLTVLDNEDHSSLAAVRQHRFGLPLCHPRPASPRFGRILAWPARGPLARSISDQP